MKPQKVIRPARFKPDPREVKTASKSNQTSRTVEHDYAMEVSQLNNRERDDNWAPPTPSKTPAEKTTKLDEKSKVHVSNEVILQAILNLENWVEEQLVDLKEQAIQSGTMLTSLAKAVQVNAEEVQECEKKVKKLEDQNVHLNKEVAELKDRAREQERYRMR